MLMIYSKNNCPFCVRAKTYLDHLDIAYLEIDIQENLDALQMLRDNGLRSVPQIYYQGKLFVEGGYDGLSKMSKEEILAEIELRDALASETL